MSDELAVAMNRLDVGDTESVKHFKRAIRQTMEIFLRFTHRYWFHEVSNQAQARSAVPAARAAISAPTRSTTRCATKWTT